MLSIFIVDVIIMLYKGKFYVKLYGLRKYCIILINIWYLEKFEDCFSCYKFKFIFVIINSYNL